MQRCDGRRPFCSACVRANRTDDCEYTDNQGRTRTQVLEETLERLQARLQELENPEDAQPILLVEPYRAREEERQANLLENFGLAAGNWWEQEEPPMQLRDMLYVPYIIYFTYQLISHSLKCQHFHALCSFGWVCLISDSIYCRTGVASWTSL